MNPRRVSHVCMHVQQACARKAWLAERLTLTKTHRQNHTRNTVVFADPFPSDEIASRRRIQNRWWSNASRIVGDTHVFFRHKRRMEVALGINRGRTVFVIDGWVVNV